MKDILLMLSRCLRHYYTLANRSRKLLWLMLPSVFLVACAIGAMFLKLPTKVEIDVDVNQVKLRTSGDTEQVLLQSVDSRSLVVAGFARVWLTPIRIWIFNPAKFDSQRKSYPDHGWIPVSFHAGDNLVLAPEGDATNTLLSIEPQPDNQNDISWGDMLAESTSSLTFSVPEPRLLSLRIAQKHQNGVIPLPETVIVIANSCAPVGLAWPYPGSSVALKIQVSRYAPLLSYESSRGGMLFQSRLRAVTSPSFLSESGLAVSEVSFEREGRLDPDPQSTLVSAGEIKYIGLESIQPVILTAKEILDVAKLRNFRVLDLVLTKDDTLKLRLQGVAGILRSGRAGNVIDRRLTVFDFFFHNGPITTIFTIVIWIIPTLIAGRKLLIDQEIIGPRQQ